MNKRLIIIATSMGAIALIALTLLAFRLTAQIGNRPVVGAPTPDFELPLYPEYRAGLPEKVQLSDLRGHVVLINFWASWCLECKKEAADLEAAYQRLKDRNVVFIGVDYLDTEQFAYNFLSEYGVSYANGIDLQQRIARQYRITGVPETFIVDKQGNLRFIALQRMSAKEIMREIEPLLAE